MYLDGMLVSKAFQVYQDLLVVSERSWAVPREHVTIPLSK